MKYKKAAAVFLCGATLISALTGCNAAQPVSTQQKSKGLYSGYENYQYYKKGKNLSGSIINLGSTPVTSYDGYLGYGYDVVRSDYFNSKDIHISSPVLDIRKMITDKLIYSRPISATSINTITGTSSESFLKNLTAKASLSASGALFKASFSSSFASTSSGDSKDSYVKTIMSIGEQRDYVLLSDIGLDDLKKYRTTAFNNMINNSNKTAEQVFDTYGTHVLLDIQMGGRMDLNYTFHNEENLSENEISARASEVYRCVKAKESASLSEKSKSFLENSSFSAEQYGGTTADNITTLTDAQDAYSTWSSSLENSKKLDFLGAADLNNPAAFIPIWELADSEERQSSLKSYYDKLVSDKQIEENNANKQTVYYVQNIYFGNDGNSSKAKSNLVANIQNGDSDSDSVKLTDFDLNDNAGGDFIFMGYSLTTDKSKAITGLLVGHSSKNNLPGNKEVDGAVYQMIDLDLNKNAGGDYIKLYYTKDPAAGDPLTAVGVELGKSKYKKSFSDNDLKGWTTVRTSNDEDKFDLNKNAGGTDVFLWQRKTTDATD